MSFTRRHSAAGPPTLAKSSETAIQFDAGRHGVKEAVFSADAKIVQLRDAIKSAFAFDEVMLKCDNMELHTTEDLKDALRFQKLIETARQADVLTAILESTMNALRSRDAVLQFQGLHCLWELVWDDTNHRFMSDSLFQATFRLVGSPELQVKSIAAATIWRLALNPATIERMQVANALPIMVQAVLADALQVAKEPTRAHVLAAAATEEQYVASPAARSRGLRQTDYCGSIASLLSHSERGQGEEVTTESEEGAARAVACTSYSILEQHVWLMGAVLSLLSAEAGRRAFYRAKTSVRLLTILEIGDERCPALIKSGCAAMLARAAELAPQVCKNLVHSGTAQLVRLMSSGNMEWRTRLQAADLIRFAFARVKLKNVASRPADMAALKLLPGLIGEVRASAMPLVAKLRSYVSEGKVNERYDEVSKVHPSVRFAPKSMSSVLLHLALACYLYDVVGRTGSPSPTRKGRLFMGDDVSFACRCIASSDGELVLVHPQPLDICARK